jgi:hypothetical protein
VTTVEKLSNAASLKDLAAMLGYSASGLSYVVYKLPPEKKYRKFGIPKRGGGAREICAPHPQLKVLQGHLAIALYACRDELDAANNQKSQHGVPVIPPDGA